MATITPGTGATIKSSSAEGQAVEILTYLQLQGTNTARNTLGANNIVGTVDLDQQVYSGTFSLPATQTISNSGSLSIVATPYLSGVIFSPGTGGTFKSETPEAYALEVLMALQGIEQTPGRNPNNANNVTGSYNSDTRIYSGSFSLPVDVSIDESGGVSITADPYLS